MEYPGVDDSMSDSLTHAFKVENGWVNAELSDPVRLTIAVNGYGCLVNG